MNWFPLLPSLFFLIMCFFHLLPKGYMNGTLICFLAGNSKKLFHMATTWGCWWYFLSSYWIFHKDVLSKLYIWNSHKNTYISLFPPNSSSKTSSVKLSCTVLIHNFSGQPVPVSNYRLYKVHFHFLSVNLLHLMPPDSYSKEANNQHCIQADNSLKDLFLQNMIVLVQLTSWSCIFKTPKLLQRHSILCIKSKGKKKKRPQTFNWLNSTFMCVYTYIWCCVYRPIYSVVCIYSTIKCYYVYLCIYLKILFILNRIATNYKLYTNQWCYLSITHPIKEDDDLISQKKTVKKPEKILHHKIIYIYPHTHWCSAEVGSYIWELN